MSVTWEDDDSTYRIIEILSAQTFYEFHTGIKQSLQLPEAMEASFFISNDHWTREKEISSIVEKNLRDAPALSMRRTPIGALINDPHQKFIYVCDHPKAWVFRIEIMLLSPAPEMVNNYPTCVKSEGISPSQFGVGIKEKDSVVEIEERYDLGGQEEGYGEEGDDDDLTGLTDDAEETGGTDLGGEEF